MQKIGTFINKIADGKEAYKELLVAPSIKALLEQYQSEIDLRLLPSFITELDEYEKEHKKCEGCLKLESCQQPIRGHLPTMTPHLGRLKLSYGPCSYLVSQSHLENIQNFHMPKSMEQASFDTIYADANREELFRLSVEFVAQFEKGTYKKGLFLYGSMGSGKTYAISAIANELARRGIGCATVYFPELIAQIKASFSNPNEPGSTVVEKLQNVPVLMLDDIGSESVTSWMRDEVLGRILNHRMAHKRPTFFTSNFNFDQLQSHYEQTNRNEYEPVKAARIIERIRALSIPIELTGKNYRDH